MWWHVSLSDSSECCVLDHATPLCCKFNSKSPAHIFKHHLWNMLINKPILAFILHYDWILCRSWRSKWVISDRQQDPPHLALCSSRVKIRTKVLGIFLLGLSLSLKWYTLTRACLYSILLIWLAYVELWWGVAWHLFDSYLLQDQRLDPQV